MKSDYREPQNPQVKPNAATSGPRMGTNNGNNTIDVGSVGLEGGGDNGASTLRELRKKHASGSGIKKPVRKPML